MLSKNGLCQRCSAEGALFLYGSQKENGLNSIYSKFEEFS